MKDFTTTKIPVAKILNDEITGLRKQLEQKKEQIKELKKAVAKYQKKYDDMVNYPCVSSLCGY